MYRVGIQLGSIFGVLNALSDSVWYGVFSVIIVFSCRFVWPALRAVRFMLGGGGKKEVTFLEFCATVI